MTTPTQQPDRCPRCDDPACDVPAAHEACKGINWYTESDDADRLHARLGKATRDCAKRPAVDWRTRCLAAEALAGTGGAVEPAPEEVERTLRALYLTFGGQDWDAIPPQILDDARAVLSGAWRGDR